MDQETFNKSQGLWIPFHHKQLNLLINPMKSLKLTEYELVYLIAQILWTLQDDEDYSEQTRLVAEEVSEQIASELHNYYLYQIGLTNYAHRLVNLTKLIESSKVVLNAKKDVFILARIFDLFECDLTKSELFDWKE
uniref:NR LBD domain-containing protein n=1 Tax=Acrobeloides nanus TaxID=290746 RepID=A0A914CDQ5_9BILA